MRFQQKSKERRYLQTVNVNGNKNLQENSNDNEVRVSILSHPKNCRKYDGLTSKTVMPEPDPS
jgi:hypothetical protein